MSDTVETVLCKVLKPIRISGVGYHEGAEVQIERRHLNHYGKSVEQIKAKKETIKVGDK